MGKPNTGLMDDTHWLQGDSAGLMPLLNKIVPGFYTSSAVHDIEQAGVNDIFQLGVTILPSFAKSFYAGIYGTVVNNPFSYYKPHQGNLIQHCFINASASNCGNAINPWK